MSDRRSIVRADSRACTFDVHGDIAVTRRVTTAQARRDWARVLRSARRGTAVEVTSNGQPVAAVVSIEQLRKIEGAQAKTIADVIRWVQAEIEPRDLEGPDPWSGVRDRTRGRDVDLR